MHWTIGSIVYAKTRAEAKALAGKAFEKLVGDEGPFDYFDIYKDEIHRANSPEGEKLVNQLMSWTKDDFVDNLGHLKEALSRMSEDEAFSESAAFDVRYRAYSIGRFEGPGIYLYDDRGNGIRTPEELLRTVTKADIDRPGVLDWTPGEKGFQMTSGLSRPTSTVKRALLLAR